MPMLDHIGLSDDAGPIDALRSDTARLWPPLPQQSPPTGWESFTSLDVSAGGAFILRNDTDYKIVNQSASGNVRLRGGRRVVVMGLAVTIDRPDTWYRESESATTGLELQENPYDETDPLSGGAPQPGRMFYCEGILLTGPHLTQGIRTACPTADLVLVNVHVAGVRFRDSDHRDGTRDNTTNHPDIIQTYGGVKSLTIDGFTGYSAYQGFFFKEDNVIINGPIGLRRVDLHAIEVSDTSGNAYAGHRMLWNYRNQPITIPDDSVWVEGHPRNGWQPRVGTGSGFHRVREWHKIADAGGINPSSTLYSFDTGLEGWTALAGTIAPEVTTVQQGAAAVSVNKTFLAMGYDSIRVVDPITVRDLSANGNALAIWVFVPAGTPGTDWKCRIGAYRATTGSPFVEQSIADAQPIVLGQWNLCAWDLSKTFYQTTTPASDFLQELRRIHIRVGANNVNAPVTIYLDTVLQGTPIGEVGEYIYDPVPSNGTHVMALNPAPDTISTDEFGQIATYNANIQGRIRLGKPGIGEYVPASSVGNGYIRPT